MSGNRVPAPIWNKHIKSLPKYPIFKQEWEIELADTLNRYLAQKDIGKTLEVGCSNGRWLRWCADNLTCECYGLDSDPAGFEDNKIEFRVGDARRMTYHDETIDLVFSLGLLEHFEYEDRRRILAEQTRVLKRGGFLLCQVPNLFGSLEYIYVKYHYDFKQGFVHHIVRPREIHHILKSFGFETVISRFTGNFFERFAWNKVRKTYQVRKHLASIRLGVLSRTEYIVLARRL